MARFKFVKKATSALAVKPIPTIPSAQLAVSPDMGAAPSKDDAAPKEQAVQQIQSQEMVQIMLHVAFGTLFYLRELYPQSCFSDCSLKAFLKLNKVSYKHFVDENESASIARQDSPPMSDGSRGRGGQPVKVLLRGHDRRLDAFLHLLESGIFDAIQKGFLQAIQVTVIVDKNNPQNVLESYTFTFKYKGSLGPLENRLESISLRESGFEANLDTMKTARVGLEMLVRRLIVLSALMPTFPRERYLAIHLIHTESCPVEYRPPGFTDSSQEVMYFPLDENWHRVGQFCGSMDAGHHTIGLQVSSLRWRGPDQDDGEDPVEIPSDIRYKEAVQRENEVGIPEPLIKLTPPPDRTASSNRQSALPTARHPKSTQLTAKVRGDTEAKQNIPQVENLSTMINPTQPRPSSVPKPNGQSHQTIKLDSESTYVLLPSKLDEIEEKRRFDGPPGSKDGYGPGSVHCHCEWEEKEAEMLECHFCATLQHSPCYGFSDLKDPRIPNIHVCYYCLLEPNEKDICQNLKMMALMRRALTIIQREGYPNRQSDFSRKLHCSGATTVVVTNLLKSKGLLQGTPGYKLKGFMATGLPKFTIPSTPQTQERIQKQLHPMLKIHHHYKRISSSSNPNLNSDYKSLATPDWAATRASISATDGAIGMNDETPSRGFDRPVITTNGGRDSQSTEHRAGFADINSAVKSSSQLPNLYDAETEESANEETQITYNTRFGTKRKLANSTPEIAQQQQDADEGKVIVLKYQPSGSQVEYGPPAKRLKMSQLPEPIDAGADSTDDGETASNA